MNTIMIETSDGSFTLEYDKDHHTLHDIYAALDLGKCSGTTEIFIQYESKRIPNALVLCKNYALHYPGSFELPFVNIKALTVTGLSSDFVKRYEEAPLKLFYDPFSDDDDFYCGFP